MTAQHEDNLRLAMLAYDSKHGGHKSKMPPDVIHKQTESETQIAVLKVIGENEGNLSIIDIHKQISCSHSTVRNNLYMLRAAGKVVSKQQGRFRVWWLAGSDAIERQVEMGGL